MQKPIVDLSKIWLAPKPSKNYVFHLLHHHIQSVNPARSLDAGVGELRNFWMFPGKYVGISHNRPAYFRGMSLLTTPHAQPDITMPLLTDTTQHPNVYLMQLESDFSFLGAFDLVVCTQTIFYVENRLDALTRLSDRVRRGGTLIIDDHVVSAPSFCDLLKSDYEEIEVVYHGYEGCNDLFAPMPSRRDVTPPPRYMELSYREMAAPNRPDNHTSFYLIARGKKHTAAPENPAPELLYDRGLFIVKKDMPHLKMDDADPNAVEKKFTRSTKRTAATRPILHIGPPKSASTAIQEFIIPKLGRPYIIKPQWGKLLSRLPDFQMAPLPAETILSDEEFGRFHLFSPEVVAGRLAPVVPDASVVFVRRNVKDHFRSYFRQALLNNLARMDAIKAADLPLAPFTPDQYFDISLELFRDKEIGFFAMARHDRVRKSFERHFEFSVLDYDQLRHNPQDFVAAFADLCGCPAPDIDIGQLNISTDARIDTAISEVPIPVAPEILMLYRHHYVDFALSPEREKILANLT